MKQQQRVRRFLCLLGLAVSVAACGTASQFAGGGIAPMLTWNLQPDQLVHDTPAGSFRVLAINNNMGLQRAMLFYMLPDSVRETPRVVSQTPNSQVMAVQGIGSIAAFRVGAIDVQWHDQMSQTLALAFSLPASNDAWTMAPLQQIHPASMHGLGGMEGYGMPEALARDAPIEAINYGNPRGIAAIEIRPTAEQPHQPSLFLVVEQDNRISMLSEAEFRSLLVPLPITGEPLEPQTTVEPSPPGAPAPNES